MLVMVCTSGEITKSEGGKDPPTNNEQASSKMMRMIAGIIQRK